MKRFHQETPKGCRAPVSWQRTELCPAQGPGSAAFALGFRVLGPPRRHCPVPPGLSRARHYITISHFQS